MGRQQELSWGDTGAAGCPTGRTAPGCTHRRHDGITGGHDREGLRVDFHETRRMRDPLHRGVAATYGPGSGIIRSNPVDDLRIEAVPEGGGFPRVNSA
jgi:hypothetical protein